LGVDIPLAEVNADRQAMCEAAETFTQAARRCQEEGIRTAIAAVYPARNANHSTTIFLFPAAVRQMRTFEELGLPVLHPGACKDEICGWDRAVSTVEAVPDFLFFKDCEPGQDFRECNDNPLYVRCIVVPQPRPSFMLFLVPVGGCVCVDIIHLLLHFTHFLFYSLLHFTNNSP